MTESDSQHTHHQEEQKGQEGSRQLQETASFTSVSVKVIKQTLLKAISKHMKDKVMESGVYQGHIVPDLLLCFLEKEVTGTAHKKRTVNLVYLDFNKAFDTVSHNLLSHQIDEIWAGKADDKVGGKLAGLPGSE